LAAYNCPLFFFSTDTEVTDGHATNTFENLTEGSTAQFLDDFEATFKDLLALL
jgi:hypothetical protein